MARYYDLYQSSIGKDESRRDCNGRALGTIYYGTISYSCNCLVKEHTRFENEPDYRPDRKLFTSTLYFVETFLTRLEFCRKSTKSFDKI